MDLLFEFWPYLALALPLMTCGLTLLNLATWPRGRPEGPKKLRVSVLIPARNEADNIEACLEAIGTQGDAVDEIMVYDDASTDRTPEILERVAERQSKLRILKGDGLPSGWVGKPHACHRLAEHAKGDVLLFLDADVALEPEGLRRILNLLDRLNADVVTAVPRQITGSFAERLILPILHVTYTSWFPLVLTYRSQDPRFLAANGQILAVRRPAYDAIGGFQAVRHEVVDDMAFCRRAKKQGHRVVFADGHCMARCRMYGSLAEIWAGFSKNLYEGIGARWYALALVLALYFGAFILPYGLLGLGSETWGLIGIAGVGANLVLRAASAVRFRQSWIGVLFHPVAIALFIGIALNSFRWHMFGRVTWRGRSYAVRTRRFGVNQTEVS